MGAGKYDKRVRLERPVSTTAPDGGQVRCWELVKTVWAQVLPVGGREAARANQTVASTETRITIRFSSVVAPIDATWRAVHGGTIYDIKRIANIKTANVEIELTCEAGVSDG